MASALSAIKCWKVSSFFLKSLYLYTHCFCVGAWSSFQHFFLSLLWLSFIVILFVCRLLSTPCILMKFPHWFNTINLWRSTVYIEGCRVKIFKKIYIFVWRSFCLKGIDYCPIEIIKGLTDKGQFQYLTKLKGPQVGNYLYTAHFLSPDKDQYFIINYLIPSWDHFIAPVGKSLSSRNDCYFDLPSMTHGESHNEWYQYYCSYFYVCKALNS